MQILIKCYKGVTDMTNKARNYKLYGYFLSSELNQKYD